MKWITKNFDPSWNECLDTLQDELNVVDSALSSLPPETIIYPSKENVFRALQLVTPQSVRVVLIGQDPYHGENQAIGLSFSVPEGLKLPPSLRNIFKERETDCGIPLTTNGDLTSWAEQGVLMLNATLTVTASNANSHQKFGWQAVTDGIISWLSDQDHPVVFLLWGNFAQKKQKLIDESKHIVISAVHPSPLSARRGFWGSKPFTKINSALKQLGYEQINWDNE